MTTLKNNTEGTIILKDNEVLNYRIYSDGFVKVSGLNYFNNFNTIAEFKSNFNIK